MQLEWKSFDIYLPAFSDFLKANCPNADGILATSDKFEVIEKTPLGEDEITSIQSYYDNLTEEGEEVKANFLSNLSIALLSCKTSIVGAASYSSLSTLQRKVMLSIELSYDEQQELISTYS